MNPNDNPSQQRANELWRRFVGMFGGDALDRKYGPSPPPEWVAMLSRLKDFELDRGIRRLAYSGAKHIPTLPEFTRLCRSLGGDDIDDGPSKPIALPNPDRFAGDKWDIAANGLLMAHIRNRMGLNSRMWGAPGMGLSRPSNEMVSAVQILTRWKSTWAAHMRDWGVDLESGEVLMPTGPERTRAWHDCMESADAEILTSKALAA